MLRSWKMFGLALVGALGAMVLLSGGAAGPGRVLAAHDEIITIEVDAPAGQGFDFEVVQNAGTACSPTGANDLEDGDTQDLNCSDNSDATIRALNIPAGFDVSDIECTMTNEGTVTSGQQTIFGDIDVGDNDIRVNIRDNEHIHCLFTFASTGTPTATPTVTGTPATATPTVTTTPQVTTVTVSVAPSTLGCNGSAFVTVVSRNAAGALVPGGAVTLQTTLGTISPTSATDSGGGVLAVLTAPQNQGGTATIKATAGGISGQATATINCAQATNTPIPPTQAPPAAIVPPSTGDAGLVQGSQASTFAGLVLLGMSFAGAAGIVWSKVRS